MGGGGMGGGGAFSLTSTTLFRCGNTLAYPPAASLNGGHHSPQLAWTGAPVGTMYFAISMIDQTNGNSVHWVIYNIPADVTMLPADLPRSMSSPDLPMIMGARQTRFSGTAPYGYFGPGAGSTNTYHLDLWALKEQIPMTANPAMKGNVYGMLTAHAVLGANNMPVRARLTGVGNSSGLMPTSPRCQ